MEKKNCTWFPYKNMPKSTGDFSNESWLFIDKHGWAHCLNSSLWPLCLACITEQGFFYGFFSFSPLGNFISPLWPLWDSFFFSQSFMAQMYSYSFFVLLLILCMKNLIADKKKKDDDNDMYP